MKKLMLLAAMLFGSASAVSGDMVFNVNVLQSCAILNGPPATSYSSPVVDYSAAANSNPSAVVTVGPRLRCSTGTSFTVSNSATNGTGNAAQNVSDDTNLTGTMSLLRAGGNNATSSDLLPGDYTIRIRKNDTSNGDVWSISGLFNPDDNNFEAEEGSYNGTVTITATIN